MTRPERVELIPFNELNAREKASGKKVSWKERYALIQEHFPASVKFDWRSSFKDVELWGKVWRDIYDSHIRDNGLDEDKKPRELLRQLMGEDFSYDPFNITFSTLAGTRSIRHLASKLDLSPHMVWRMKQGTKRIDLNTMERVAKAFGKDPSYFVEYRIAYILGALGDQMERSPETSADLYRRLKKNG